MMQTIAVSGLCLVGACDRPCGPEGASTEACPIHECAQECRSVEQGIQCCIDQLGRGLPPHFQKRADESGASADERAGWLSPRAALCVAQVHGLPSSDLACYPLLRPETHGQVWEAASVTQACDGENTEYWANTIDLDVVSGEFLSAGAFGYDCR